MLTNESVFEAVGAMPRQGVASNFRFGEGYGLWQGLLAGLQIPHVLVTPQAWKKVVLAGTVKDRAAAIGHCQRRYPGVSLRPTPRARVPHDGLAEALCLAEYGLHLVRDHSVARPAGCPTAVLS